MRRFSESGERHSVEDRVIDLMIAAEALSEASSSRKKGKVIAQYVASQSLGIDKGKVEDHMLGTYRLRNTVMHDGEASEWLKKNGMQQGELISFVNMAEHHLRQALRKSIETAAQ
jgi:hypothetical protein